MRINFLNILGIMTLCTLIACQPSLPAPTQIPQVQVAQSSPQVTIQGDNQNREEVQTIELNNCDGKGDMTRTEQRFQSVDVTISAEIASKIGASAAVISADVQAAVGASSTQGASRGMSIQLLAPPRTRMVFQLSWTGKEQIGVVQNVRNSNIPIAFRTFVPSDVRIKGQQDLGCPGGGAPQPVIVPPTYAPLPTLTPYPTVPPPTARPTLPPFTPTTAQVTSAQPHGYCYGNCWDYDDNARTMTYRYIADGNEDVWQAPGEPLQKIRSGYTAIFQTSVPGEIYACILTVNGTVAKSSCDQVLYKVPIGKYRMTSANNDVGGFRWCPEVGIGWRSQGGTCR